MSSLHGLFILLFLMSMLEKDIGLQLLHRQVLTDIPSGSGITAIDGQLYVVGDNSPWLFRLDQQFKITAKIPLIKASGIPDGIIAKADKPDFEALATIRIKGEELIVFGSGSKSPQRDLLIRMDPRLEKAETYSLTAFYDHLRSADILQGHELNIEAVALDESRLFLFNRKKNVLFIYPFTAFLDHIDKGTAYPEPESIELLVPEIDGIEAGISGATVIPGAQKIIFTASVEDTPNAIDDGKVLGSFVGIIDLEEIKKDQRPTCVLIMQGEQPLKLKVESVMIRHQRAINEAEILLVTDSDGNESEIITAVLKWK